MKHAIFPCSTPRAVSGCGEKTHVIYLLFCFQNEATCYQPSSVPCDVGRPERHRPRTQTTQVNVFPFFTWKSLVGFPLLKCRCYEGQTTIEPIKAHASRIMLPVEYPDYFCCIIYFITCTNCGNLPASHQQIIIVSLLKLALMWKLRGDLTKYKFFVTVLK